MSTTTVGAECVVAPFDQWYLNNGDPEWRAKTVKCLKLSVRFWGSCPRMTSFRAVCVKPNPTSLILEVLSGQRVKKVWNVTLFPTTFGWGPSLTNASGTCLIVYFVCMMDHRRWRKWLSPFSVSSLLVRDMVSRTRGISLLLACRFLLYTWWLSGANMHLAHQYISKQRHHVNHKIA